MELLVWALIHQEIHADKEIMEHSFGEAAKSISLGALSAVLHPMELKINKRPQQDLIADNVYVV